ncbi:hypothetical protein CKAH01_10703 [Colletotrichum kahawae]|uniref:Uncharacterized protein n=1 Tax=Colletotrichum kahawae TaxID=34407 RepID=A0AAD9XWW5_COLKA|nr:hypothetical protein CKAH01_10703 [Colletotrichum kahawae]
MAPRISIQDLVIPDPVKHTVLDEPEVCLEDVFRPQTPSAHDTSSTNIQHHRMRQDVEWCPGIRSNAMPINRLLPPAKIISSGEPTLDDIFSVYTLQSTAVTSSSMALQKEMFRGRGIPSPAIYPVQSCPACLYNSFMSTYSWGSLCDQQHLDISVPVTCRSAWLCPTYLYFCGWHPGCGSGAGDLLENCMSSGYCVDSTHLEAGLNHGCLTGAPDLGYATQAEPLQPWAYGFGGQPIPQQDFVLESGKHWGVAGEQFRPNNVHTAAFTSRITPLDD